MPLPTQPQQQKDGARIQRSRHLRALLEWQASHPGDLAAEAEREAAMAAMMERQERTDYVFGFVRVFNEKEPNP